MATITNDSDAPEYIVPLLGDLVIGSGESVDMSDDDARGFLGHPHITVAGLPEQLEATAADAQAAADAAAAEAKAAADTALEQATVETIPPPDDAPRISDNTEVA